MIRACQQLAAQTPPRVGADMEKTWRKLGLRGASLRARELRPDEEQETFTLKDMLPLARLCQERGAPDESLALAQLTVELAGNSADQAEADIRTAALSMVESLKDVE